MPSADNLAMPGTDAIAATLAQLLEERLGGMMLVRIGLTELLERFKQEEHALATSLKAILQLRDEERTALRAQLDSAHSYAHQLEAQLLEAQRLRSEAVAAAQAAALQAATAAAATAAAAQPPRVAAPPEVVVEEAPAPAMPPPPASRPIGAAEPADASALPSVETVAARVLSGGSAAELHNVHRPAPLKAAEGVGGDFGVSSGLGGGGRLPSVLAPGGAIDRIEARHESANESSALRQLQQRLANERRSLPVSRPSHPPALLAADRAAMPMAEGCAIRAARCPRACPARASASPTAVNALVS